MSEEKKPDLSKMQWINEQRAAYRDPQETYSDALEKQIDTLRSERELLMAVVRAAKRLDAFIEKRDDVHAVFTVKDSAEMAEARSALAALPSGLLEIEK